MYINTVFMNIQVYFAYFPEYALIGRYTPPGLSVFYLYGLKFNKNHALPLAVSPFSQYSNSKYVRQRTENCALSFD